MDRYFPPSGHPPYLASKVVRKPGGRSRPAFFFLFLFLFCYIPMQVHLYDGGVVDRALAAETRLYSRNHNKNTHTGPLYSISAQGLNPFFSSFDLFLFFSFLFFLFF